MAVIGVVPSSGLPIALRLPIPLSIRFGETLEPVSDENLARGVHNSASFIVDTLYFLEQEMGNKRERRESNLELKIFGSQIVRDYMLSLYAWV